jgi:hypothetical protein
LVDVKGMADGDTFRLVSISETKLKKEKEGSPKSGPKMD